MEKKSIPIAEDAEIGSFSRLRRSKEGKTPDSNGKSPSLLRKVLITLGVILVFLIAGGTKLILDAQHTSTTTFATVKRTEKTATPDLSQGKPFSFLFLAVNGKDLDDVVLFTLNPAKHTATVVNMDHNLYIDAAGASLTEIYAQGGTGAVLDNVQTELNTPLNKYMTFNMSGLGQLVASAGDVSISNPTHFIANRYEFISGTVALKTKAQAQAYITEASSPQESPDARIQREQDVLMTLLPTLKTPHSLLAADSFLSIANGHLKQNFSFSEAKNLAIHYYKAFGNIAKRNIHTQPSVINGENYLVTDQNELTQAHNMIKAAFK
ncbi:MAG: LCP family protein [Streptococcaceae bacterium]|jgi:anionic cell wall polymer biosynthesis LytR-Cps2A-Psr (LCP) family protein|nr:LCP family protein [Streptococcaceae bacterium]